MTRFDFYKLIARPFVEWRTWWPIALAIAGAIGFCVVIPFYR
jgi:hypothetical protein